MFVCLLAKKLPALAPLSRENKHSPRPLGNTKLAYSSGRAKFKLHVLRFLPHKKPIETERRLRKKQNRETNREFKKAALET